MPAVQPGVRGRGRTAAARAAHHPPQEWPFLFGEGSGFPADFRFAAAGSFLGMLDRLAAADTLVVYMDEMKQKRIHKHQGALKTTYFRGHLRLRSRFFESKVTDPRR